MNKILSLLFVVATLAGCANEKSQREIENEKSNLACREKGGIPIPSVWNHMISECQFPPNTMTPNALR